MRKTMVVRAGSAIGRALIEKLVAQGTETVAFSKSERKLAIMRESYSTIPTFRAISGNARNSDELVRATEGVDVIIYGAYLTYDDKPDTVNRMTQAIMETAERIGAKVVRVDGIYRQRGDSGLSDTPNLLRIHSPELYGATANDTFVHYALKKIAQAKPVSLLGDPEVKRDYLYVSDAAARILELASLDKAYGGTWNLRGGESISIKRLAAIAGEAIGTKPLLKPIGGWKLRLLKGYDRRVAEMLDEYNRDNSEDHEYGMTYEGGDSLTPYEIGIAETVRYLAKK